jgi:hypothetical protein
MELHFMPSHLGGVFAKSMEAYPINTTEVSIRIFPKLKRGTVENGVKICWLTTAGF